MTSQETIVLPGAMEGISLATFGSGLGMPPELPRFHRRFAPIDYLDQRLAGCEWHVVACEVPPTEALPEYPHMRFWDHTGAITAQWQVWYWCTWQPPALLRTVVLWHPTHGVSWNIADLLPTEGDAAFRRAWRWLKAVKGYSQRGRSLNSGIIRTREEFIERLIPAAEALKGYRGRVGKKVLADKCNLSRATLVRCEKKFQIDAEAFVEQRRKGL